MAIYQFLQLSGFYLLRLNVKLGRTEHLFEVLTQYEILRFLTLLAFQNVPIPDQVIGLTRQP